MQFSYENPVVIDNRNSIVKHFDPIKQKLRKITRRTIAKIKAKPKKTTHDHDDEYYDEKASSSEYYIPRFENLIKPKSNSKQ